MRTGRAPHRSRPCRRQPRRSDEGPGGRSLAGWPAGRTIGPGGGGSATPGALAVLGFLAITAGCACVPPHDSFASPRDTLLTFQSAYCRDDPATEFRCLSRPLRRRATHAGYRTFRDRVIADHQAMAFVLGWNDLTDNIVTEEIAPDGRRGYLVLSVYGHQVTFEFVRELYLVIRMSPDVSGDPPELRETIFSGDRPEDACRLIEGGLLQVPLEDIEFSPEELRRVRGWLLDERWKFAELEPVGAAST